MKKFYPVWVLVAAMIVGLMSQPLSIYAKPSTNEQLHDAQADYEDMQGRVDSAQEELGTLNDEKNELEDSLEELNNKLTDISNVLAELEKSIDDKHSEIDETWGRIEALAIQIDEAKEAADLQYELTKAQIKYMYEQGDNLYIALLMSADNFADYINKNSYIDMMTEYQQEQLKKYQELEEQLTGKQSEYEKELVKLEEEKSELDAYETSVIEQQEKIKGLIDDTTDKISAYTQQISSVESKMLRYEEQMDEKASDISVLKKKLEEEKEASKKAQQSTWRDISDISTASSDRKLMANIIWCEAGNEPYVGKVAVGAVVMNRIMSSVYPDTIVGVIYQKGQFTPASSGRLALALAEDQADEECYQAADAAMSGVTNVGNCLYFRTPSSSVSPKYTIGGHVFY